MELMTDQVILRGIEKIVREALNQSTITLTPESSPLEFGNWNSFAQVRIVLGIEEHFGMRMTLAEARRWVTIQAIIDSVQRHCAR
jgi:acyl carrier protein